MTVFARGRDGTDTEPKTQDRGSRSRDPRGDSVAAGSINVTREIAAARRLTSAVEANYGRLQ